MCIGCLRTWTACVYEAPGTWRLGRSSQRPPARTPARTLAGSHSHSLAHARHGRCSSPRGWASCPWWCAARPRWCWRRAAWPMTAASRPSSSSAGTPAGRASASARLLCVPGSRAARKGGAIPAARSRPGGRVRVRAHASACACPARLRLVCALVFLLVWSRECNVACEPVLRAAAAHAGPRFIRCARPGTNNESPGARAA